MIDKNIKKVLLFGSTGFIGKSFISFSEDKYNIFSVTRKHIDFEKNIDHIPQFFEKTLKLEKNHKYDACLFFQGIGPSLSTKKITVTHFERMMRINVISPAVILKYLIENKYLNRDCSVIFLSSIAANKGSYDSAYASSKSALKGLIQSLSNAYSNIRFNSLSLGLIDSSPTHLGMSSDFVLKHKKAMFENKLIDIKDVIKTVHFIIENKGITRSEIPLDGGYKL